VAEDWEHASVMLQVLVPSWSLQGEGDVLTVGDQVEWTLVFREVDRSAAAPGDGELTAVATRLQPDRTWSDAHAVRLAVGEASLYWEAAEPAHGAVAPFGRVVLDVEGDAPDDFPTTTGTITGMRMQTYKYVQELPGHPNWGALLETVAYKEIPITGFPDDVSHADGSKNKWTGVLVDLQVQSP
jgi:hypothetical protein